MKHVRRKILVAMGLDTSARREMLSGIFRFVNSHASWSILFKQTDTLNVATISSAVKDGVDGILAAELSNDSAYAALMSCGIPALVQRRMESTSKCDGCDCDIAWVETDNEKVGRHGANYLLSVGKFASFAFVPSESPDAIWSRQRGKGFAAELAKKGIACQFFPGGDLSKWLVQLKLPSAVFCAYDQRALQVLSASANMGMKVPSHLAILGVDNDDLLCATAKVPLSSISLDHEAFGYDMMSMLASGLRTRTRMTGNISLKNVKVVERESTMPPVPATVLISRALDYISQNATHGLTPKELVVRMGVSERLLYLRFRELLNITPGNAILDAKLKAVEKRLRQGRESFGVICTACGFNSPKHLARIFKRRYGCTMRDWRKQNRTR